MAQFQVFSTKRNIRVALVEAPDLSAALARAKTQFRLFDHIDNDDVPFVAKGPLDIKDATLERYGWVWIIAERNGFN